MHTHMNRTLSVFEDFILIQIIQIFGHKSKHWTHFDLIVALDKKKSGHPQIDYNLSFGRHECLYQISWQSIQKLLRHLTEHLKCQPPDGGKDKGDHQSHNDPSCGNHECLY